MSALEQAKAVFLQALEHHARERLPEAEALYRQALQLAPDRVSVLFNLSIILMRTGRTHEARQRAERALQLDPSCTEALSILAELQRERQGPEQALAEVERGLQQWPDEPDLLLQRSALLADLGRFPEALAASAVALSRRPGHAPALTHQALLNAAVGNTDAALNELRVLLQTDPQYLPAAEAWVRLLLKHLAEQPEIVGFKPEASLMARALDAPWAAPRQLLPPACRLLRADPRVAAWIDRVAAAWPEQLPTRSLADLRLGPAIFGQPLLRALLRQPLIPDSAIERLLINLRSWLLQRAEDSNDIAWSEPQLAFHCALAAHCLRNRHAYPQSDAEHAQALRLRHRLLHAIDNDQPIHPAWLPALIACLPLASLRDAKRLQERSWPVSVQALLSFALADAATLLPSLRWTRASCSPRPLSLPDYLLERRGQAHTGALPGVPNPRVLALGCGAGEWAIELVQRVYGAQVLALDPDPDCVAATTDQAQRLRLPQLRCAQGGLAQAGAGGYTLIDSGRSLLVDPRPLAQLPELKRWLAPLGLLRIRLASGRLRSALRAARVHLAEAGLGPSPDDLRRARELILALPESDPARGVSAVAEFYALGSCRSLLFEYEASALDLRGLATRLQSAGLRFRGFELDPDERAVLAASPSPPADLQAWAEFEAAQPRAFTSLYTCWVGLG
jgi:Tfp pilus assembly protein PilF/SAM-dependent methyltransferase